VKWDLPRSVRVPNLKFLASLIPDLRKGFKIQFLVPGPDHALFGDSVDAVINEKPYSIVHEKADVLIARSTVSDPIPFRVTHSNNDSTGRSCMSNLCLSLILSVCPYDYSKKNDPKMSQLGIGNDLGIAYG